jgi:carbon-monoxide dehydrogenase small subunit
MNATQTVSMTVNGRSVTVNAEDRSQLVDSLRDELQLTGTHIGCEHGVCGACTVMVDGVPTRSCITLSPSCEGADIRTVEGFEDDALMIALREAFSEHHALQCGYCTPGMLLTAYDIASRFDDPSELRIREELGGNLCRCTGYLGIVKAIKAVAFRSDLSPICLPTPLVPIQEQSHTFPKAGPRVTRQTAPPVAQQGNEKDGYSLDIPVAANALWEVLSDVDKVAACLPGAIILETKSAIEVRFQFDLSVGPMRTQFIGDATIELDSKQREGRVHAQGQDAISRSVAGGKLQFFVAEKTPNLSTLRSLLEYELSGPFAQFGRGPIIDAVIESVMQQFGRNVAAMLAGERVEDGAPISALSLGLSALWLKIKQSLGLSHK